MIFVILLYSFFGNLKMDVNQKGGEMTHSKIFNQVESDAHQVIGDIKIQEICKRYSFGNKQFLNKIKNIVDKILLKLKFSDLVKNDEAILLVFNQETDYCLEPRVKVKIRKIINDISQLLALSLK